MRMHDALQKMTSTGFIRGILRGVRYAKSLRVLFLHRRSPSWTTLVLYSRVVFIFNEPTTGRLARRSAKSAGQFKRALPPRCAGQLWRAGQIKREGPIKREVPIRRAGPLRCAGL